LRLLRVEIVEGLRLLSNASQQPQQLNNPAAKLPHFTELYNLQRAVHYNNARKPVQAYDMYEKKAACLCTPLEQNPFYRMKLNC